MTCSDHRDILDYQAHARCVGGRSGQGHAPGGFRCAVAGMDTNQQFRTTTPGTKNSPGRYSVPGLTMSNRCRSLDRELLKRYTSQPASKLG